MARDPRQGSSGSAPERTRTPPEDARQREFGEVAGDDGWTLIGDAEEAPQPSDADARPALEVTLAPTTAPDAALEPEVLSSPATRPEPAAERDGEVAAPSDELDSDPFAAEVAQSEPEPEPEPRAVQEPPPPRPLPPRPAAPPAAGPTARAAPTPAPRRPAPAVALAALATIALLGLAWRHARVVDALEGELAAERAHAPAPQGPSPEAEAELARLRAEAARLERELADATGRATAAQAASARESEARERATALAAERDALGSELATVRAELQRAESRASESQAALDALGVELERARQVAPAAPIGPDERRAEVCERVLGRIEAGQGAAARAQLDAGLAAGLFAPAAQDGSAFLADLAAAAEALERARVERATSTAPATASALAALEHLQAARAALPDFADQAAGWLGRDARGGPAPDPLALRSRVERALAQLESEAGGLGARIDDLHGSDWSWLASRGPAQDPRLAREHARTFACAHLTELAQAAAQELRADCLADGTPVVERLLAADCLPAWAEILGAQAERTEAELELLWLDAARRWYAAAAPAVGFEWHGLEAPAVEERGRDWRAELWLRVRLAQPESAWPPRPGEVALYQLTGPSRARWRTDRRVDDGAGTGWTWLRTHFDEHGATLGEPELVEVELAGERARLADAGLVLLDLRAPLPGCEVAPAPVPPIVRPPRETGFDERAVLAHVAEATRSSCLVVPQGDTARWFSPRLGLMLEERALASGTARVELAVREAVP